MSRLVILAGVAVIAGGAIGALTNSPALAQPPGPALPTHDFIMAAAQTDQFEREEGRLAADRSGDPRVRAFASMMIHDHAKTTAGLKRAIRMDHMKAPPTPHLTDDQMHKLQALKDMHGPDFDHAYIAQQIEAHRMALGVMQAEATGGTDAPIRKAAADTAPIVQHHLMMAEMIRDGRR